MPMLIHRSIPGNYSEPLLLSHYIHYKSFQILPEHHCCRCQPYRTVISDKQLHIQFCFHGSNLTTQCRLRDKQFICRFRKIQTLCCRDKIFHLNHVHSAKTSWFFHTTIFRLFLQKKHADKRKSCCTCLYHRTSCTLHGIFHQITRCIVLSIFSFLPSAEKTPAQIPNTAINAMHSNHPTLCHRNCQHILFPL